MARLGVVIAGVGALLIDPSPPWVDRWYVFAIYPRLQRWLTGLTNAVPLAIFDLVVVAVVTWSLWRLTGTIRSACRRRAAEAASGALALAAAAALLYLLFLGLWGLNYRRTALLQVLDTRGAPTEVDVERLGEQSVRALNQLYDGAHRVMVPGADLRQSQLASALASVSAALGAPTGSPRPGRMKPTLLGPWFRWSGIDGMTNPFGLEVLVNPDLLPVERPFVAAHEWAHLAGFANESEASYVGWLACLKGDAWAQYSGWMFMYWQLAGDLPPDARTRLASALGSGARGDIAAITERLRRGRVPLLQEGSWRVYDQYLKANRVQSGVRSYGEVVTLALRARTTPDGLPVLRPRD